MQLLDEALEAAVKLSHRYIPARQLPDKSVSLLDTACARVAISQHAVPPQVEDSRRRIEALTTELEIIGRERAVGIDVAGREAEAEAALVEEQRRLRDSGGALGAGEDAGRRNPGAAGEAARAYRTGRRHRQPAGEGSRRGGSDHAGRGGAWTWRRQRRD